MAKFKKKSIADYETDEADDALFASRLTPAAAPAAAPAAPAPAAPAPAASTQAYSYGKISEADREVARSLEGAATPPAPAARGPQALFGSPFSFGALRGVGRSVEDRALIDFFGDAIEEEQGGFQFEDTLPEMKQTVADINAGKKKKKAT